MNAAVGYVHHCVFCGTHAEAAEPAPANATCAECGSPVRCCEAAAWPEIAAVLEAQRAARRPRLDGALPLALMIAAPWVLALFGAEFPVLLYLVTAVFSVFGAALCVVASRRVNEPHAAWLIYAASAAAVAAAATTGLVLEVLGRSTDPAFTVAAVASALLPLAIALHVRPRLRFIGRANVLGPMEVATLVAVATVVFVVAPGFSDGSALLAASVVVCLLAFVAAGLLAASGRRRDDRSVGRRIWATAGCALIAQSLVTRGASPDVAVGVLAVAAWFLAGAATLERPAPVPAGQEDADPPSFRVGLRGPWTTRTSSSSSRPSSSTASSR